MTATATVTQAPVRYEINYDHLYFIVLVFTGDDLSGTSDYLRDLNGNVRMFRSRSGARKAILRDRRFRAGETSALHR